MFWIALGLAVGRAAQIQSEQGDPAPAAHQPGAVARRSPVPRWALGLLAGSVLIFSVPLRAKQELAETNLSRVSYGLFEWGTDPDGTRSRWSRPSSRSTSMAVRASSRSRWATSRFGPASCARSKSASRADSSIVFQWGPSGNVYGWHLPGEPREESRRIDFTVTPPWIPAEEIDASEDRRVLGVKVGELKVHSVGGG